MIIKDDSKQLIGINKIIDIPTKDLFEVLSHKVLFEARWGFTKGNLTDEEYKSIIENKAKPALDKLIKQEETAHLIECKAVYGFFEAIGEGDRIIVRKNSDFSVEKKDSESIFLDNEIELNCKNSSFNKCFVDNKNKKMISLSDNKKYYQVLDNKNIQDEAVVLFEFPRQEKDSHLCIADFINHDQTDCIPFFIVTLGSKIIKAEKKLFEDNAYYDYHLLHGLGAELADCAAVCIHKKICCELFPKTYNRKDKPLGCRYSFGYPSCPDLTYQKKLFALLEPSKIGLTLTESCQMVPELSVSGFIIVNDKARYFVP